MIPQAKWMCYHGFGMSKWWKFGVSIGVCFAIAALGSVITTPAIPTWYESLNKPFFNPPAWVFGPVWSFLYLCMSFSLFLFWDRADKKSLKIGLPLFGIQLFLNFFWSFLFFGVRNPLLAFGEIIFLWVLIFMTIEQFSPTSRTASRLLIPYLAWVSFAALLNLSIFLLNPKL